MNEAADTTFPRLDAAKPIRLILAQVTTDNAAMILSQPLPLRRLTCSGCGAEFECGTGGRDGGCWCMDRENRLPMPTANSADCLCPACLHAALQAAARSA
jgi:Cysteine-rich CWC